MHVTLSLLFSLVLFHRNESEKSKWIWYKARRDNSKVNKSLTLLCLHTQTVCGISVLSVYVYVVFNFIASVDCKKKISLLSIFFFFFTFVFLFRVGENCYFMSFLECNPVRRCTCLQLYTTQWWKSLCSCTLFRHLLFCRCYYFYSSFLIRQQYLTNIIISHLKLK